MKHAILEGWKNKRTTIASLLTGLSVILAALGFHLDDDPTTVPDWTAAVAAAGLIITGLLARDADGS